MPLSNLPIHIPALECAIDPAPILVSPDTLISDAIARMGQVKGSNCEISCALDDPHLFPALEDSKKTAALVMDRSRLVGIITERDIVRLAASGRNFSHSQVRQSMTSPVMTLTQDGNQTVFTALSLFRQHRIRHLPIFDSKQNLQGMVTTGSIRRVLQPLSLLKWRRVEEVMNTRVIGAASNTSLIDLATIMDNRQVSCVVITETVPGQSQSGQSQSGQSQSGQSQSRQIPVGIVTERDIVQYQTLELNLHQIQAHEVMSTPLFSISLAETLVTAYHEMQQRRIRRLVVTGEQGTLLGIVTQTSMLQIFDPIEMYSVVDILRQSVEERTVELESALHKQQELNELKSRFVSMASHDLRNPLTAILGTTELAELYLAQGNFAGQMKCMQRIRAATEHMAQLLNDLLILGQIESGTLKVERVPVELEKFCHQLIEEVKFGTDRKHAIYLTYSGYGKTVHADKKLLRQILVNLLVNGIKYSPDEATIDLIVILQDGETIFKVQDRGIGIPVQDRQNLFQSFKRASNVGDIPGTGLGLAIVKQCVELHQGKITFTSTVGTGTTFTVVLPDR